MWCRWCCCGVGVVLCPVLGRHGPSIMVYNGLSKHSELMLVSIALMFVVLYQRRAIMKLPGALRFHYF